MNWLAWRQHRKQFLVIGILLALYAAVVIPTGLHFWAVYQQALANCAQNPATPSCSDLAGNLLQSNTDQLLFRFVPLTILFLPILLGIFWGAPLLAREYSDGTNKLVWTQSVSRRKWLTVKLVWVLVATAVIVGAFVALNTWWSRTPNALNMNRFDGGYTSQNVVPVAYALFTVAFAIMLGAWFRKTMIAVGVVLGIFIALVLIVVPNFVRPHYMAPITVTAPMGPDVLATKIPSGAWVVSMIIVDKNGNKFDRLDFPNMPAKCQQLIQQSQTSSGGHVGIRIKAVDGPDDIDNCLNTAGYHQIAKYQPSNRYWDFQWIEAALYLALAAGAVGATYWLVLKRDA